MRYYLYKRITFFQRFVATRLTQSGKLFCTMAIIAGFFGLNTEKSMFYQFFPILFCFVIVGFLFSLRFKNSVSCKRFLPETCIAEQKLTYRLNIKNPGKELNGLFFKEKIISPVPTKQQYDHVKKINISSKNWFLKKIKYAHWKSLLPNEKKLELPDIEFPALPANQNIEYEAHLLPMKRGNIHVDGFTLFKKDPLGLFTSHLFYPAPQNILVLPKLYPAPQLNFDGSRKYHQGGLIAASDHGDSEEFVSLREYTAGDPLKKIDWKSTARTRQLIVKQFKNEYFSRYGLILDTFIDHPESDIFESAVSIAASLIMAQELKEDVLDLMFVGNKFYIETAGKGMTDQHHMLKILASVEQCEESRFNELLSLLKTHADLVSGLVIICVNLNQERQKLLDLIVTLQIPHKTILVCENAVQAKRHAASRNMKHPILFIEPNEITEQLSQL